MGLFDKLVGNTVPAQQGQQTQPTQITPEMMRKEVNSVQANPSAYLAQRGFKIPANLTDPKQITTYLLQSGQIGNGRLQQVLRGLGAIK